VLFHVSIPDLYFDTMKFNNSETRYLEFYCAPPDIQEETNGTSKFMFKIIEKGGCKTFSIKWRLYFINDFGKEVYIETTETRFNYFSLGNIENDFRDLKIFLGNFVLGIFKNLASKNEQLFFPEINLESLACKVLVTIIMNE
jgi:hypothetical protein